MDLAGTGWLQPGSKTSTKFTWGTSHTAVLHGLHPPHICTCGGNATDSVLRSLDQSKAVVPGGASGSRACLGAALAFSAAFASRSLDAQAAEEDTSLAN